MTSPLVLLHICAATAGLLSGFGAMLLRKGSSLHRAAGSVFTVSMLLMSSSAAYIAAFMRPNRMNVVAGLFTFYLVATGWWATRRRDGERSVIDWTAFVFAAALAVSALMFGLEALGPPVIKGQMVALFIFGSAVLLCAGSDARLLRRRGLLGRRRIVRHLWRMSLALLIATMSFFPGQARNLPVSFRHTFAIYLPHVFVIASMTFWYFRLRFARAARRVAAQRSDPTSEQRPSPIGASQPFDGSLRPS
jgi:hypothetical protein